MGASPCTRTCHDRCLVSCRPSSSRYTSSYTPPALPSCLARSRSSPPSQAFLQALRSLIAVRHSDVLINIFYLEPQSTRVMFERYELENAGKKDSDEYKLAAKKFGPLHGMSSLANLGALIFTLAHSWWLGGVIKF